MSPEARADMATSCLEVWRDSEFDMPETCEEARAMVADDLECLSIEHDEADLFDIAVRIMAAIVAETPADIARESDS